MGPDKCPEAACKPHLEVIGLPLLEAQCAEIHLPILADQVCGLHAADPFASNAVRLQLQGMRIAGLR